MSYELEARVVKAGEVQSFNGFTVCRFWVEIPHEKYPQTLEMEAAGEKPVERASVLKPGDYVKLKFDLRGRAVKCRDNSERVFNTLRAWYIDVIESASSGEPPRDGVEDSANVSDENLPW